MVDPEKQGACIYLNQRLETGQFCSIVVSIDQPVLQACVLWFKELGL